MPIFRHRWEIEAPGNTAIFPGAGIIMRSCTSTAFVVTACIARYFGQQFRCGDSQHFCYLAKAKAKLGLP
jgi:hypothetical protein